jgi:hypothetical protein
MTQTPLTPPSPQGGEGKGEGEIRISVIGIYLFFGAWYLVLFSLPIIPLFHFSIIPICSYFNFPINADAIVFFWISFVPS